MVLLIAGGFFGALLLAGAIIQWHRRGDMAFYAEPADDDSPAHIPQFIQGKSQPP
jgi:hypothetical protein